MSQADPWAATVWRAVASVLARNDAPPSSVAAVRSARHAIYRVQLVDHRAVGKALALGPQIGHVLHAPAVRVAQVRGAIEVAVPLPAKLVVWPDWGTGIGAGLVVPIGVGAAGKWVTVDLGAPHTPHLGIFGQTGSGKSVALAAIITRLCTQNRPEDLGLVLIDGKGLTLRAFAHASHMRARLAVTPQDATALLQAVQATFPSRREAETRDRIVVAIDEVGALTDATGGPEGPFSVALRTIAALGRELGVHVIVTTQHPTADLLGRLVAVNVRLRLVGSVADAAASRLVTGQPGAGAETLLGKGDCLLVDGESVTRIQVAMPPDEIVLSLPRGGERFTLEVNETMLTSAPPGQQPSPITPAEVAALLVEGECGVQRAATVLRNTTGSCGTKRAQRVRDYVESVRAGVRASGCDISHVSGPSEVAPARARVTDPPPSRG